MNKILEEEIAILEENRITAMFIQDLMKRPGFYLLNVPCSLAQMWNFYVGKN